MSLSRRILYSLPLTSTSEPPYLPKITSSPTAYGKLAAVAAIEQLASADGNHFAALWLLLSGVGQHDATGGYFFGFGRFNNNAIVQRTEIDFGHDSIPY